MNLDPRTPVIVGVGQVVSRPRAGVDPLTRPTPLDLMVDSLQAAMNDASRAAWSFDEMIAINSVGWTTSNPARMVANALGVAVTRTRKTPTGGDTPQRLVHDCARRIQRGDIDAVAIVGSEAIYTASSAQKAGVTLDWPLQPNDIDAAETTGEDTVPFSDVEHAQGLVWPTEFYPLFENARRARLGWTIDEQRRRLGELWSNFSRVAATNPYAWITTPLSAHEIATASPTNRYVGFPYTKFLVANLPVDMGASIIMTSYADAVSRGVSRDQMVFPHVGAEGYDHWYVSQRPVLDDSPAMRAIWNSLRASGVGVDDLAHLDLYSCFPTVVQTAAEVIGIDAFDPLRVPTVTGGLTFGGGPGNNYVTHSIATMATKLREDPSTRGLVTGVGWYCTKHAWGVYGASPPPRPFDFRNVQDVVDAEPVCPTRQGDGAITIESYLVAHRHDGTRKKLVVAGRFHDGARVLSHSNDDAAMEMFETREMIGLSAYVREGLFSLSTTR